MASTDYTALLRQKQLKVRFSDGSIPGSIIFPLSGVAFLVVPLGKATCSHPETQHLKLTAELEDRLDRFIEVHRNSYVMCQAPLHGTTERNIFSLIQRKYLHTRLNLMPVHNANEAVKTMLTIAKALCKPVSVILRGRLHHVVTEYQQGDIMSAAMKHLALNSHDCQVVEDGLGSLSKLSSATYEELQDCSLNADTALRVISFFS